MKWGGAVTSWGRTIATGAILVIGLSMASPGGSSAWAQTPPPKVSAHDLERLSARVSDKVLEIHRAREIARQHGARLATYGGTSREIITFVQDGVAEHGSVAAFEKWLEVQPRIHLLDWHRVASDLDLMILPIESTSSQGESSEGVQDLAKLSQLIENELPGNGFYKKFDLQVADEFFKKFPVGGEHLEAFSNIILTERGIERIPELQVQTRTHGLINMADWGLRQLAEHRLEFELAPDFATNTKLREDTYGNLRQVLRWIRYASEAPYATLSEKSRESIRALLSHVVTHHKTEAIRLLKEGDVLRLGQGEKSREKSGKLIDTLERIQLYSRDSHKTRKLLDELGITELAREAEVQEARIFEPLPDRPKGFVPPKDARHPKPGTVLLHRSSLAAAQNLHLGALWMSNNRSVFLGRKTVAAHTDGIYAAPKLDQIGYGDFSVRFELAPDAIEGVDYVEVSHGGIYVLRTRQAIARNSDGSFKIERIGMERVVRSFFDELEVAGSPRPGEVAPDPLKLVHVYSLIRGLGSVISVEGGEADTQHFRKLLAIARRWDGARPQDPASEELLRQLRDRPGIRAALDRNPSFYRAYLEATSSLPRMFPWDLDRPNDLAILKRVASLKTLMMEKDSGDYSLSFANILFKAQPRSFTEKFPEFLDLVTLGRGYYTLFESDSLYSPHELMFKRIAGKLAEGQVPLANWEATVFRLFIQRRVNAVYMTLGEISRRGWPGSIRRILALDSSDSTWREIARYILSGNILPADQVTLFQEIPEARERLLRHIELGNRLDRASDFAWDLSQARDHVVLKEIYAKRSARHEELKASQPPSRARNLAAQAFQGVHDFFIDLANAQPEAFCALLPEIAHGIGFFPIPTFRFDRATKKVSVSGHKAELMRPLLDHQGTLSPEQRAFVVKSLASDLVGRGALLDFFAFLLSSGGEAAQLAENRMLELRPGDDREFLDRVEILRQEWPYVSYRMGVLKSRLEMSEKWRKCMGRTLRQL